MLVVPTVVGHPHQQARDELSRHQIDGRGQRLGISASCDRGRDDEFRRSNARRLAAKNRDRRRRGIFEAERVGPGRCFSAERKVTCGWKRLTRVIWQERVCFAELFRFKEACPQQVSLRTQGPILEREFRSVRPGRTPGPYACVLSVLKDGVEVLRTQTQGVMGPALGGDSGEKVTTDTIRILTTHRA